MPASEPDPNGMSLAFIEGLYEDFLNDPASVPEDWRAYFESVDGDVSLRGKTLRPSFRPSSLFNPPGGDGVDGRRVEERIHRITELQHQVDNLIRNYRIRGHLMARLDPLGSAPPELPELDLASYGIREDELDWQFSASTLAKSQTLPLREIVARLQNTYCRSIGVQFMHIDDIAVRDWLTKRMERTENRLKLAREEQLRILTRLTDAAIFEEFIQKKYPGAKSFSLEGAESLIPLLDLAIEKAGEHGIREIVMGMAHRGRLNVLANIMGKSPVHIFREYEDKDPEQYTGRGDVKYHLGYHTEWTTQSGNKVHLALCFNPSHLEFVNPVALGRMRAWQDRTGDTDHRRGMVILIHGDASFIGEGIVQETLNLSQLRGYSTGGTLHIIVNNQIGFTTDPRDARSSPYCTDVARMLQIPIFHVNGEDPEAVAQVVDLAMKFRKNFRRDVVIDMYCYRKRGHNEGDEPSFTHPLVYREIAKRKPVRDAYLERLLEMGGITREDAEKIVERRRAALEEALSEARAKPQERPPSLLRGIWQQYQGGPDKDVPEVDTGVAKERLVALLHSLNTVPEGFTPHPKFQRILETRAAMARGEHPIDWAVAEALAMASLAVEGARVRLSGQDSQRGTFSHRHAVLHDYENGATYMPLKNVAADQAAVDIFNSPLSEAAVLGFEYGYSLAYPDGLILWEAQFGDFWNVAQVVVDQFISSAEDKWRSLSGLTLLLPHGFEGMGPEHSSARLERFLSLAAEDNIQVCVPTTPAQFFHLLRRQVKRPWRKPLVVLTPKSLLRHPKCVSSLDELASGRFQRILPDSHQLSSKVRRILMCAGKIYYELEAEREKLGVTDVAIIRVQQLYPLQPEHLKAVMDPYPSETPVYWVQEEPENMGAWRRMKGKFGERLLGRFPFTVVSRPASASPATGSAHSHRIEQELILNVAFGDVETSWY